MTQIGIEELHRALGGKITRGTNGMQVLCAGPGHSDNDRSLAVSPAANGDGFIVFSHADDDVNACKDHVRKKLGLPPFQPGNGGDHAAQSQRKIAKTYDYTDEGGNLLFQVCRFDPKDFRQRRPDGKGGWIWNLEGVRRVPYRLPEILEAIGSERPVFVVEGEKDADALWRLGVPTTCNPQGAGKWRDEYSSHLKGATVHVVADNDPPGRAHAQQVAQSLTQASAEVRVIDLPGVPVAGGASDWIKAGGSAEQLYALADRVPIWSVDHPRENVPPVEKTISLTFFNDLAQPTPKPWLIKNVIARGETSSWIAPPGKGKSALLTNISVHLAGGADWRGHRTKDRAGVVYFALERADLVKRRLIAHKLRDDLPVLPIAVAGQVIDLMSKSCVDIIVAAIDRAEQHFGCDVGLGIFDTYSKAIAAGGGDESSAKDQNIALANVRRILDRKVNIHIAGIGHTGKDESRGERGSNARLADVDLLTQITGEAVKSAIVTKANDQPDGSLTSFRLEAFDFGPDADGDPFRTYILAREIFTSVTSDRPITDQQRLAIEALIEVTLSHGMDLPAVDGLPMGLKSVTADQWKAELLRRNVIDKDARNPRARSMNCEHGWPPRS